MSLAYSMAYCPWSRTASTFSVIATSSTEVLSFVAFGYTVSQTLRVPPGDFVLLDSVRVTGPAAPSPGVPEASTWAMMLCGFAGLGFAAYRKARPAVSIA